MSHLLLNTSTKDYFELIGNGATYRVPTYQRDYSWDEDQWTDLWTDMVALKTEKDHYLGYLVLQKNKNEKDYWIIDGQQRLATLTIFALAVKHLLIQWSQDPSIPEKERRDHEKRAEALHHRFVGNYSASKLTTTSKIQLNRNNDDFFHAHLLYPDPPSRAAKLKPSQKLLYKAYEFFLSRLKEKYPHPDGAGLAAFLEDEIAPHLVFTTIEVSDEFSAYKVFETLNARGVRLSPSDLLKNYLFSLAVKNDTTDFEEAERLWQYISDKIGEGDLPTYIRSFWNSRYDFVRSAELYRTIRMKIDTKEKVFGFLRDLNNAADLYSALNDPNNSVWAKEQKYSIKILKMLRGSVCHSLLMAAQSQFKTKEFTKLLHELVVIIFRRTIIGNMSANELETVFHHCSREIFAGKISTAKKAYQILKPLSVKDQEFLSSFSLKELPYPLKKDLIRYILAEMENHLNQNNEIQYDGDFTLEHIMPQSDSSVWEKDFSVDERYDYLNRLANFSSLEKEINDKLKNDWPLSKKVEYYKTSSYRLTKEISKFSQWTASTIDKRQEEMAKIALQIWKTAFGK